MRNKPAGGGKSHLCVVLESPLLWGSFSEVFSAGALDRIFENFKTSDVLKCKTTEDAKLKCPATEKVLLRRLRGDEPAHWHRAIRTE